MRRGSAGGWPAAGGICLLALGVFGVGCAGPGESSRSLSRVIPETPTTSVQRQAELLLRREFGRVTIDAQAGRLETGPNEFVARTGSGSSRELYGGPSTLRRKAILLIEPRGADTVARLRVDVEREDTLSQESMRPDQNRLSDSPAYTSIERDAATTPAQNRVWTYVRRDRALERQLLDELAALFARSAPEPAGQAADHAVPRPADEKRPAAEASESPATPASEPAGAQRSLEPVPTGGP